MGAFLSFITDTIHVNCCSRVEYVAPPLALRLTAISMLVPSSRLPLVSSFTYEDALQQLSTASVGWWVPENLDQQIHIQT